MGPPPRQPIERIRKSLREPKHTSNQRQRSQNYYPGKIFQIISETQLSYERKKRKKPEDTLEFLYHSFFMAKSKEFLPMTGPNIYERLLRMHRTVLAISSP